MRIHGILATTALSATLFTAAPALAQDAGASETPQGVIEIIVTAQRRAENIQDVPVSVTAIRQDALAAINSS